MASRPNATPEENGTDFALIFCTCESRTTARERERETSRRAQPAVPFDVGFFVCGVACALFSSVGFVDSARHKARRDMGAECG